MRALALSLVALAFVACGGDKEPAKSADSQSVPEPSDPPPAPATATPNGSVAPPVAGPPKKKRPYEIANLCPRPATIIFGEDAKAPTAGRKTLGGNDKIDDGPRDGDGNQIIWLVVRDEPLVKVRVSRSTKRIEIGTSCDTLEMH